MRFSSAPQHSTAISQSTLFCRNGSTTVVSGRNSIGKKVLFPTICGLEFGYSYRKLCTTGRRGKFQDLVLSRLTYNPPAQKGNILQVQSPSTCRAKPQRVIFSHTQQRSYPTGLDDTQPGRWAVQIPDQLRRCFTTCSQISRSTLYPKF